MTWTCARMKRDGDNANAQSQLITAIVSIYTLNNTFADQSENWKILHINQVHEDVIQN